jgi:hypothetical protein
MTGRLLTSRDVADFLGLSTPSRSRSGTDAEVDEADLLGQHNAELRGRRAFRMLFGDAARGKERSP